MNIPADVRKFYEITTVVRLESNRDVLFGGDYFSRFQRNQAAQGNQGEQVRLEDLEPYWEKKFKSFAYCWNSERQNYRFFYDTFRLFWYSFYQLRRNKVNGIKEIEKEDKTNYIQNIILYGNLASTNLFGVYSNGKRCIDIMKELKLINSDDKFLPKFSKTRNTIFEHNFKKPDHMALQIEPVFWSVGSTDSLLEIRIHTKDEAAFTAKIDYYEDYYKLEEILTGIIRSF